MSHVMQPRAVYVQTNEPENAVIAFSRSADGAPRSGRTQPAAPVTRSLT
jgi:hypothetical protein